MVWIDEENARDITITQAAGTEVPAGERKFYVTENGSTDNSGLHWDEPTTLEWALGEAVAGEEIHIAAGTYTPTKFLTGTETSGNDNNNNAVNALRCAPDCVVLRTYKLSHRDGVRPI